MQKMEETMKSVKYRTDYISSIEHSMRSILSNEYRESSQRSTYRWCFLTDAKIDEKVDAKIEEKFSVLEMKIDAVEKRSTEANGTTWDEEGTNGKSRAVPIATGFKEDSVENDVKACDGRNYQSDGNERSGIHDRLPCNPDHTCLCGIPEYEDQRQVC